MSSPVGSIDTRLVVLRGNSRSGKSSLATALRERPMSVVLEGILWSTKYGEMIRRLLADHRGSNFVYYLRVDFDETVARHTASTDAAEWTAEDMRSWWNDNDLLGIPEETVLNARHPQFQLLSQIERDLGNTVD